MINMRLAFNLLILSILFVCIWFTYNGTDCKAYYKNVFKGILWVSNLLYLNRFYALLMEEKYIPCTDGMLTVERTIHYMMTLTIYTLYAYFIYCLLNQFHYYSKKKKILFWTPFVIVNVLILLSLIPEFDLIFYVENGVCHIGKLFFLLVLTRFGYGIIATVTALRKRNLMIKIFGQSVILIAVFTTMQIIEYGILYDEGLYYSTLITNILILLLTVTMIEFYKDNVTGLLNRAAFKQYAEKEIDKSFNKKVYFLKLKNFEYLVNNCHEVPMQDIIKQLAEYIKEFSMLSSIYYLGNGRYVIILRNREKLDEKEFLKKLEENFCISFEVNGANINLSLFVAVMDVEKDRINKKNFYKLLQSYDEMKYYSSDLIEVVHGGSFGAGRAQRYHYVEEAIERALVENEFKIYYQPIVSAKTQRIISAEALIRLNDRVLGFVSPEEFIPISEDNGKILEISEFVIDSVFRFVKETDLEAIGIEFIEMNLSMMQCMDRRLPEKLEYYLNKYDIDPKMINLEITETATNFDEERLKEQLIRVKKLGFSFSLDDYGTGYSNLVQVLEYPVDIIKIDKSIIWSAFHIQDNFVTLKNLISMFHDVRRKIVAEGVESDEQKETLIELGCDYLQGYYYSKPVPERDFIKFVSHFNFD